MIVSFMAYRQIFRNHEQVLNVCCGEGFMKKLLFLVNTFSFFVSHRLPIAVRALKEGFEVHVAAGGQAEDCRDIIPAGITLHPLGLTRGRFGVVGDMLFVREFFRKVKQINPDIVHLVTIKPVLYGGIICRIARVRGVVYAISGLGSLFIGDGIKDRVVRSIVKILYRVALTSPNNCIIFQNVDDKKEVLGLLSRKRVCYKMIPGSGVDLSKFSNLNKERAVIRVLYASRLIEDKGLMEYVEASYRLKKKYDNVRFVVAGAFDYGNPSSIGPGSIQKWVSDGVIDYIGNRKDIPSVLEKTYIVVLPSYREGFPKILIEAAAAGLASVVTDVPGCRDAVDNGVTGVIVPAKDSRLLEKAIENLILNPAECYSLGRNARLKAEKLFDISRVVDTHMQIYKSLLSCYLDTK